ncbi:iron chelate uptake ABC transporter family permease subunit [Dermacoccaceae bacterium W4C1]
MTAVLGRRADPRAGEVERRRARRVLLSLAVAAVITAVIISTYQFWDAAGANEYAMNLRTRQIVALAVAGVCVGVSAVIFQTLAGSPLLTPGVMGFDALYMLIATFIVFFFGTDTFLDLPPAWTTVMNAAALTIFGLVIFGGLLRVTGRNLVVLVLIGIVCSTLFGSLTSFASRLLSPEDYLTVQDAMFASFSTADEKVLAVVAIGTLLVCLATVPLIRYLDVINLGPEQAIALGVPYRRVVLAALAVVTVLVAGSTALVGPMTFLGLVVANLARQLARTPRHLPLLATAALVGVAATVGGQLVVARVLDFAAPLAVVVNLVGGVYFIYLLTRTVRL